MLPCTIPRSENPNFHVNLAQSTRTPPAGEFNLRQSLRQAYLHAPPEDRYPPLMVHLTDLALDPAFA